MAPVPTTHTVIDPEIFFYIYPMGRGAANRCLHRDFRLNRVCSIKCSPFVMSRTRWNLLYLLFTRIKTILFLSNMREPCAHVPLLPTGNHLPAWFEIYGEKLKQYRKMSSQENVYAIVCFPFFFVFVFFFGFREIERFYIKKTHIQFVHKLFKLK